MEKQSSFKAATTVPTSFPERRLGDRWSQAGAGVLSAVALAIGSSAAAQEAIGTDERGEFVRGRVVVAARAGLLAADVDQIVRGHGGRARAIGQTGLFVVELPANASEVAVAQQLARNPHLKFAELDRRFNLAFTPNDPYFGSQWHSAKIGAPTAWDYSQGAGVTIAILDSGVDANHPDLTGRLVPGWNFYGGNSDTMDYRGHGTGMAGIAAGALNNGIGVAAIAGKATIMPVRVSDDNGGVSGSTLAQALNYVAEKGVRIASMSISGAAGNSTVETAVQYLMSKGGLVFAAAGNNSTELAVGSTNIIAVSATDENDLLTSFSNWGSFVSMSAPGVNVASTKLGGTYSYWSGTSASTPLVASTAALMMSANPKLSNIQIQSLLFSTATDLGAAGRDKYYGYGRVNTGAAVKAATAATAADTTAPTVSMASPTGGSTVSGMVGVDVSASDNVGVAKVEFRVNGSTVATDTSTPYGFSWDSTKLANGTATLTAVAYDAAGNSATTAPISVYVSNASTVLADTTPPVVAISSPSGGTMISGTFVTVTASASDNGGASGITQSLYIDGALKSTVTGGSLNYKWNVRKLSAGAHTIQVVARDQAGNNAAASIQVNR